MPGIVRRGRKRTSAALSEDENPSDASSQNSLGTKRARYVRDASIDSEELATTNGYTTQPRAQNARPNDEERPAESHQPGSIVRVTLKNFVTYTAAEFLPGPSLNMVIGPNGTGKSTLVCAICLGLGWDPKNLGRAKEIGEYVKHGCTQASIEIELAAQPGQNTNPVICRKIVKENNKSAFSINGRQATQKQVTKLAKEFSIQIDNLCQFLPQDRVVEFAKLEPIALLRETLRAAAPQQMVDWHDELIALRSKEKRLETEQKNEDNHLKQLQARQNSTREDVDRWNQRQELLVKSKTLEKCRPIIESRLLKRQVEEVKVEKRAAKHELRQLLAEVEPARNAQEEMEAYQAQVESVRNERRSHVEKAKQRADKLATDIKDGRGSIDESSKQIERERDGEKRRRQDVKRLENAIANIERARQDVPPELDEEGFRVQRRELRSKMSSYDRREDEIKSEMQAIQRRAHELKTDFTRKQKERADLDTRSGQQASLLGNISKDTAEGWDWIQKHQDGLQFKGEVHGPPILTCSVTDPQYADIVESFLRQNDVTAITCTNSDDARLLSNKLVGKDGLGLHNISIRTVPQPLAFYRSPVTRDQLRDYGFERWVLDCIQGPEPVLAMLCDQSQLHRAAYTPNQLTSEQYQAVEQSPIASWVAGRDRYRITRRREYGQHSTSVLQVNAAKWFTDKPVDADKKRQLDDEIREMRQESTELKERHSTLKEEQQQLKVESEQAEADFKVITQERDMKQKARAEWELLPQKKNEKLRELESLFGMMRDTGNRIMEIKAQSERTALKVASLAIDYAKAVSLLRQVHENLVEAEIRLVEANSEVDALKAENTQMNQAIQAKRDAVKTLEERSATLVQQHNRLVRKAQQDINQLTEEERLIAEEFSELPTIEDLNNEIDAIQARLDLMADGNPDAVRAYENREREIEKSEDKITQIVEQLETTKEQVREICEQWEPQLDELVDKISDSFSHNFAQIGCAGQVGVYKDDDFENWSIQIQVRFREHESLSILDSHRQSGGERAVSTIFYLMALQDFARAPFRVVDEINQGMDPRNERMVHERMVDIACRERTSQYFLVTPKLLPDLKYHPKMMVHCIGSGEHMPKNKAMNIPQLADLAMRVKLGRVAA